MLPKYNRRQIKKETNRLVTNAEEERRAEEQERQAENDIPIPSFMDLVSEHPHVQPHIMEIRQYSTIV